MKNILLILIGVILLSVSMESCVVENPNHVNHQYIMVERKGYWGHPKSSRPPHHWGRRHNWQRN